MWWRVLEFLRDVLKIAVVAMGDEQWILAGPLNQIGLFELFNLLNCLCFNLKLGYHAPCKKVTGWSAPTTKIPSRVNIFFTLRLNWIPAFLLNCDHLTIGTTHLPQGLFSTLALWDRSVSAICARMGSSGASSLFAMQWLNSYRFLYHNHLYLSPFLSLWVICQLTVLRIRRFGQSDCQKYFYCVKGHLWNVMASLPPAPERLWHFVLGSCHSTQHTEVSSWPHCTLQSIEIISSSYISKCIFMFFLIP